MSFRHIFHREPDPELRTRRLEEWDAAYDAATLAGALMFENGAPCPKRPRESRWHPDEDTNWEHATRFGMWVGYREAERTREMVVEVEMERGMQQLANFLRAA